MHLLVGFLIFLWSGVLLPLVTGRFNLFRAAYLWNRIFHPTPPPHVTVYLVPGSPYLTLPARSVQFTPGTPVTQSRYPKEP